MLYLRYRQPSVDLTTDPSSPHPDEFVRFILDFAAANGTSKLDPHLRPMWQTCPFCSVDFDVIGKMETFGDDIDFVANALNVQLDSSLRNNNKLKGADHRKRMTSWFLKQIPRDLIQRFVHEILKTDYELLGYNISELQYV